MDRRDSGKRRGESKSQRVATRRPTMTEIARAAGCSQTTVSLVLNRKPGFNISLELRKRVADAAYDLGYRVRVPSTPGKGLDACDSADSDGKRSQRGISQTSKVVREIGLAITSHRFPPNSILPRDGDLMAHFGVSRTVLREALKVLAGKRLLVSRARIGTRVRDRSEWNFFDPDLLMWHAEVGLDENFIKYVGEIRWALEPEAAALAAQRRQDTDIDRLYKHVDRMGIPGVSRLDFVRADLDFHVAVATASANPFLRAISALIEVALVEAFTRSWPGDDVNGTARSTAHHRAIVDAIARHDENDARDKMRVVVGEGIARVAKH
jgi:DNA-binding FadR family transcriptional regulator